MIRSRSSANRKAAARKAGSGHSKQLTVSLDRSELATILAALRFHGDENLQGGGKIPDRVVRDIATDGGKLKALNDEQVQQLAQRLKKSKAAGLLIDPPPPDRGDEPLFRVVYSIDVSAATAQVAADVAQRILSDPDSMLPVLHIIDSSGRITDIDLAAA